MIKQKTARTASIYMLLLLLYQIFINFSMSIGLTLIDVSIDFFVIQIVFQLLCFMVPFVIYLQSVGRPIRNVLLLHPLKPANFFLIAGIMLFIQPTFMLLSAVSSFFFPNAASEVLEIMYQYPLWIVLITTAVVPAICEEVTFRGIIYHNIKNYGFWPKALLSALFFALMHLNLQQLLYTFAAGLLLAFILHLTKSIYAVFLAHFTMNASQTILGYFSLRLQASMELDSQAMNALTETVSFSDTLVSVAILIAVTLPVLTILFYLFVRYNLQNTPVLLADDKPDETVQPWEENARPIFNWAFWAVLAIYVVFNLLFVVWPVYSNTAN